MEAPVDTSTLDKPQFHLSEFDFPLPSELDIGAPFGKTDPADTQHLSS